jgi:hypothetical protein
VALGNERRIVAVDLETRRAQELAPFREDWASPGFGLMLTVDPDERFLVVCMSEQAESDLILVEGLE